MSEATEANPNSKPAPDGIRCQNSLDFFAKFGEFLTF